MNKWYSQWDDFLNESEEAVELGSSGNVKKWLGSRWATMKDSAKKNLKLALEELVESKEAGHLFLRYASGEKLELEEEAF